ncbi:hypothetical protein Dimus_020832, partial [Dionaea muscipula]
KLHGSAGRKNGCSRPFDRSSLDPPSATMDHAAALLPVATPLTAQAQPAPVPDLNPAPDPSILVGLTLA